MSASSTAVMRTCLLMVAFSALPAGDALAAEGGSGGLKVGWSTRLVNATRPAAPCAATQLIDPQEHYSDLRTQAVAFEDALGRRAVLVSADVMMIPHETADAIRAAVRRRHGIEPAGVCVHATHNHSAPSLVVRETYRDPTLFDPGYPALFERQTLAAVDEAISRLAPARMRLVQDLCTSVAINRRGRGPDGKVLPISPNNLGTVDFAVRVLVVEPPEGGPPRLIMAEHAAHPVTTYFQLGADYPGFARERLERRYPGASAVFLQGCAGNIRVQILNEQRDAWVPGTQGMARRFGLDIADAVERALAKPGQAIDGPIQARAEEAQVPLAGPAAGQAIPLRVQAFRFGSGEQPFVLIGLGTEPFVEYGLNLERRLAPARVMVLGYANALAGYLPTAAGCEEGGYEPNAWGEGWYALPGPYSPAAEQVVLDTATRLARK